MLKPDTKSLQSQLGNFVRTNKSKLKGKVREERLHHYRRLVRNIVGGSISSAYPITKKILNESEWEDLIDDFLLNHDSHEPQVWKYPKELIKFFEKTGYHKETLNKEFLLDLLKFEWMEMEVYAMEDIELNINQNNPKVISENSIITLNPYNKLEHFTYPVHMKNYKYIDEQEGNYFILCYRKISNLEVRYLSFSPLDTIIFENFQNENTIENIVGRLKDITGEKEQNLKSFLIDLIYKLRSKEIILEY